jgi:acyl-CoA dehydrogenase
MSLALTDEQTMLANTAGAFVAEHSPIARIRRLRDTKDERGYSLDLYRRMADLGWTGVPFAESDGGMGMGLAALILVTEAMGRGLAPEPILTSVAAAGQALALGGTAEQKARWLAPVIAGEKVLALAYQEKDSRFDLARVSAHARRAEGGWILTGGKAHVLDGHLADAWVVAARTSGEPADARGITLFVVPGDAPGVKTTRWWRIDTPRNAAGLSLDGVRVGESDVLGAVDEGHALLSRVIDRATVALCGEMLGSMSESFDRTLAYLKERKQFERVIGSFQALKHRAARMYMEIELSRSATMAAARALDAGEASAPALVSVAKARCSDAFVSIANEAIQMHGGIGMTDEHDIGFFFKRARVAEMTFGDSAYHRDRYATLSGY